MTLSPTGTDSEGTLRDFWERFYFPTVLERFDLKDAWHLVQTGGSQSLTAALEVLVGMSDRCRLERMSRVLHRAVVWDGACAEERSLLAANILALFKSGMSETHRALLPSVEEFILEGKRANVRRPLPTKFLVELTNNCNLNCVMCGVGAKGYDAGRTMPLSFFHRLCREELHGAKVIRLNGLGESTVIPGFEAYLDVVGELRSELELVTNLTTTSDTLLQRLVSMDLMLFVSCDAVVPEDMTRIRRGLDVTRFMENLQSLAHLSSANRRDPLRTQIIMTLLSSNFRQLPFMVEFAAQHRVGGVIANMQKGSNHWMRTMYPQLIETFREAQEVAERLGIQLMVPDQLEGAQVGLDFVAVSNAARCPTFREEAFIRYNGDVCPCNMMNPFVYGNLRESRIGEVQGTPSSLLFDYLMGTPSRHPYCRNCYYLRKP